MCSTRRISRWLSYSPAASGGSRRGNGGRSPGSAFLIACLGSLVVTRAARADVTLAFLAFYVGLLFTRALWLGDPLTIPLHQIESGALLIFSFFMISDPKTTPDSRTGRIVYALPDRTRGTLRPVRLLQTKWTALGTDRVFAARSVARSSVPRCSIRLVQADDRSLSCVRSHVPVASTTKEVFMRHAIVSDTHLSDRAIPLERRGLGLLRVLRRQGGHQALQQSVRSRHRAPRQQDRHHHGQRLQGRCQGIRDGRTGTNCPGKRPDSRRRSGRAETSGRLFSTTAGGILRRESLPTL